MKSFYAGMVAVALGSVVGCGSKESAGGPGATGKAPLYGEAENSFNVTAPSTSLNQGETKVVSIGIKRGTNFQGDVALKFAEVPQGVTVEPASPVLKHGESETKVTFKAAAGAALGDFSVKVTGHPTKGGDGSTDFKLTVAKDPKVAAKAKQDEYVHEMDKKLVELDAKYKALEQRASGAKGDAKKDLDEKVKAAKAKRDAAAKKLDELKEAAPDRWEKIKDGVGDAFDDLKKMFQ